ncbi:hypothetical protein [Micromonospora auratinigra]|uniref:Uncharacterized protein n=1 Tax=Micromonospora auratinigra TaxID=261654 RepID=A0A1A9A9E7_9ACTN|nr:hypothetical protein [Micromonospora auratinigra]SBT52824.1 hypothetical protein GA0070611_5810 [Micromonospora auratinigra]
MYVRLRHLQQDPVSAWFTETFPHQDGLRAEIAADLSRCPVLLTDPPDKSYFGRVVELAIGLALGDQNPYPRLFRCLDPGLATRLLIMAGHQPVAGATGYDAGRRSHPAARPARLFTAASRLAHVHVVLNAFDRQHSDADAVANTRQVLAQYPHLLYGAPRETYQTRRAFRIVWSSYHSGFHDALRSYGPATAQLSLLDGHRHADFLLGTTVLEVKSGRLDEDRYLDELIRQILTYALLAHHDGHPVTHVAVYATRYQRLLRYRFDELTHQLAANPIDLTATAAELATLIRNQPRYGLAA